MKATLVLDAAALTFFPSLMAYSALSDLFTMTIANRISILLVAGFLALAAVTGMPVAEIGIDHLACGAAILVLTFTLFAFGWIGGGDAKLAAAIAVWIGWAHLFDYGLLTSVLGAGLTILILRLRKTTIFPTWRDTPWIARLLDPLNGVPYGIALAAAGLILYPDTPLWHSIVGV